MLVRGFKPVRTGTKRKMPTSNGADKQNDAKDMSLGGRVDGKTTSAISTAEEGRHLTFFKFTSHKRVKDSLPLQRLALEAIRGPRCRRFFPSILNAVKYPSSSVPDRIYEYAHTLELPLVPGFRRYRRTGCTVAGVGANRHHQHVRRGIADGFLGKWIRAISTWRTAIFIVVAGTGSTSHKEAICDTSANVLVMTFARRPRRYNQCGDTTKARTNGSSSVWAYSYIRSEPN